MKIRSGYVSNSSSSSFLIIYNDMSDFIKFSQFEGYEIFVNDALKAEFDEDKTLRKTIFSHVATMVRDDLYTFMNSILYKTSEWFDSYTNDTYDFVNDSNFESEHSKLLDIARKNVDELIKALIKRFGKRKINKILESRGKEIYEFFKDNPQDFSDFSDLTRIYFDKLYESEFSDAVNKFTEEIIDEYKKLGKKIILLRYYDEQKSGSYMEHSFMPFLAKNPEGKYKIYITNEH